MRPSKNRLNYDYYLRQNSNLYISARIRSYPNVDQADEAALGIRQI